MGISISIDFFIRRRVDILGMIILKERVFVDLKENSEDESVSNRSAGSKRFISPEERQPLNSKRIAEATAMPRGAA